MSRTTLPARPLFLSVLLILAPTTVGAQPTADSPAATSHDRQEASAERPAAYGELVDLFREWREFQSPEMTDGVPDYTAPAMERQYEELPDWRERLAAVDTTGWSVSHKIDWYLVWAEMNGLEFAHRVKRPWARDPGYYVWFYPDPTDIPEREGPTIHGAIELPNYDWPLSDADAAEIAGRLRNAPALFEQARANLAESNARDLWVTGTRSMRQQGENLRAFAGTVEGEHPELAAAAREAGAASSEFAAWLAERASSKTGPSGVGKEAYTWNLKNVHLLPYSWEEEVQLMKRELARAHSSLRMEEHRNRHLPWLRKIDDPEEYNERRNRAVDIYVDFLDDEDIVPMKDYIEPALRAQVDTFTASDGLRGFFSEIGYRDPLIMRTHDYHWIDLARMEHEPHESPIRSTPLLYNLFDGRAEGMATGMEEWMMHAGLLDDRPRSRELVWILLAQRAARGLGGLYQHGHEMTFDEATEFASRWTPRGVLPADGGTIQGEEQFYLQQPAYGTSYVIGKLEIDRLMAEWARMHGGDFVMKDFTREFNASGVIPVSLIYWEMTGSRAMLDAAIGGE